MAAAGGALSGIGAASASGSMDIFSTMLGIVGSHKAAKRAEKFYEKMRSTAYQTMVQDLEAAGLNPALAVGAAGGHASPASAPVIKADFDTKGLHGSVGRALSAAKQVRATTEEVGLLKAQRSKAEQDSALVGPRAEAEIDLMDSQSVRNFEEAKLAISHGSESSARSRHIAEQEISTRVNRLLGETELPAARARAQFDQSETGEAMLQFRRFMDMLPSVRGSFGSSSWRGRSGSGRHYSGGVD